MKGERPGITATKEDEVIKIPEKEKKVESEKPEDKKE